MKKSKSTVDTQKKQMLPEEPFLQRWSQRKLEGANSNDTDPDANKAAHMAHGEPVASSDNTELPSEQFRLQWLLITQSKRSVEAGGIAKIISSSPVQFGRRPE